MADIQTATGAPAHVLEAALRQLVTVIAGEIGDRDLIAAAVLATTEAEKLKTKASQAPRFDLTVNQMRQAIEFETGGFNPDTEDELETSLTFCVGPLQMNEAGTEIQECTHCWLTDLAEEGAIPLDEYPTAQDLAKAQAPAASEQDARVQWWLATLDQYGNPTLTDGAHQERAGADKAAYLIDAMNLGRGKKYAVARVELSEPKPSSDGVNHDAIAMHNRSAQAAQQGGAA